MGMLKGWSGPLARRQFRPRQSLSDAAGDEMPKDDVGTHRVDMRIVRAQSKCALDVLDRNVRLAEPCFHEPTEGPGPGQIGIERQCALDEGGSRLEVADDIREGKTRRAESDGIVLAQLHSPLGRPLGFSDEQLASTVRGGMPKAEAKLASSAMARANSESASLLPCFVHR